MNSLLVFAVVVVAVLFLWHRHKTREQWRQVGGILDAIAQGGRPGSFILHGETALRRIGLGLETLADERDRLARRISQEGFNVQAILSSMAEGVMVVDASRRIRLVNASFLQLFGLETAPLGSSILHSLRNAAVEEMIRNALETGETVGRETTLPAPGRQFGHQFGRGQDRLLAMSASPVRDTGGVLLGAVAIFRDVSLIRQLEQVRREFVANVSHELRTPLSIFQGYLEMLKDQPEMPPEERAQALEVLQKHSLRLNLLVEDLLSLARLEARREELELVSVRLEEVLNETAADWRLKFDARKVRLRIDSAPHLPPVMADRVRLDQVLQNLLENALKYTPEGGEVAIRTAFVPAPGKEGGVVDFGEVELRVSDSGSGIPPEDLPHIFERFYRADKARSRSLGGTGLGLSIVKHIVQAHGGSVHAESLYGQGTSIILRLPAAPLLAGGGARQEMGGQAEPGQGRGLGLA